MQQCFCLLAIQKIIPSVLSVIRNFNLNISQLDIATVCQFNARKINSKIFTFVTVIETDVPRPWRPRKKNICLLDCSLRRRNLLIHALHLHIY